MISSSRIKGTFLSEGISGNRGSTAVNLALATDLVCTRILTFLPNGDLPNLLRIGKVWRKSASKEYLWKDRFESEGVGPSNIKRTMSLGDMYSMNKEEQKRLFNRFLQDVSKIISTSSSICLNELLDLLNPQQILKIIQRFAEDKNLLRCNQHGMFIAQVIDQIVPIDCQLALKIANELDRPFKNAARSAIAEALAPSNAQLALNIADTLDLFFKDTAYSAIAEALAPSDAQLALNIADTLENLSTRLKTFSRIAKILVSSNFLQQADQACNRAFNGFLQNQCHDLESEIIDIARIQAQINPNGCFNVADQIKKSDLVIRCQIIAQLEMAKRCLSPKKAQDYIDNGVKLSDQFDNSVYKGLALFEIAVVQDQIDSSGKSSHFIDAGVKALNTTEDAITFILTEKDAVIHSLFQIDPQKALEVVAALKGNDEIKVKALSKIIESSPTDPQIRARFFALVREIANRFEDVLKDKLFDSVSQALAPTEPQQALDVAVNIINNAQKVETFSKIIGFAPTDSQKRAGFFLEVREIANQFEGLLKDKFLDSVSQALATTDLRQAQQVADEISNSYHKALALLAVAEVLAKIDPCQAAKVYDQLLKALDAHEGWNFDNETQMCKMLLKLSNSYLSPQVFH